MGNLNRKGRMKGSISDDTERMELWRNGKTDREIAEITHYEYETIYDWRKRRGLPSNWRRDNVRCRVD